MTIVPSREVGAHLRLVDVEDARLGERAVGQDAHLRAGVAARLDAHLLQRDREQADGHLLAGRRDDVELARAGRSPTAPSRAPAAGWSRRPSPTHDDDLVAVAMELRDAPRDVADALDAADRRAAVLLDDQGHGTRGPTRSQRAEHQRGVGAAEAERVRQRDADRHPARVSAARNRGRTADRWLTRLTVGGAIWSRIASTVNTASMPPAAPSRWPVIDLVERHGELLRVIAERALDRDASRRCRRAASTCRAR